MPKQIPKPLNVPRTFRGYCFVVRTSGDATPLYDNGDPTAGHCLSSLAFELVARRVTESESPQEGEIVVASLEGYLLNRSLWGDTAIGDALDSIDDDTADFLSVFKADNENVDFSLRHLEEQFFLDSPSGPVVLLSKLAVPTQWRGNGLGSALLAHVLRYRCAGADCAILKPYPLQFGSGCPDAPMAAKQWMEERGHGRFGNDLDKAQKRLIKLYASLGFALIKGKAPWMLLSFAEEHGRAWTHALKRI